MAFFTLPRGRDYTDCQNLRFFDKQRTRSPRSSLWRGWIAPTAPLHQTLQKGSATKQTDREKCVSLI